MGDDIRSGSICFDFCSTNVVQLSNRKYVVYGRLTTIGNSLSLDPNRCHYPLITYLSHTIRRLNEQSFCRFVKWLEFCLLIQKLSQWQIAKICKSYFIFIGNYQMNNLTLFDMIFKMTALCYREKRWIRIKYDQIRQNLN